MTARVYWGCTTLNCERGMGSATPIPMPRDAHVCPDCGGDLHEIVDGAPGDPQADHVEYVNEEVTNET